MPPAANRPAANRPPNDQVVEGYRPAPVSPPVASGPVQEPLPAIRLRASPDYIPPLLGPPPSSASVDRRPPLPSASGPTGAVGSDNSVGAVGDSAAPSGPNAPPQPAMPPDPAKSPTAAESPAPDNRSPPPDAAAVANGPANPGSANAPAKPDPAKHDDGPASYKQLCPGAEEVAHVGPRVILASDLNVAFNNWVEGQKKSKKPFTPEQIRQGHTEIEVALLKQMTEEIMLYQDVVRQVPEEGFKHIHDKVNEVFETEEIPRRIKNAGVGVPSGARRETGEDGHVAGAGETDLHPGDAGATSGSNSRSRPTTRPSRPKRSSTTIGEHLAEFEHPARVKWEELMVRKSRHPNRDEAIGPVGATWGTRCSTGPSWTRLPGPAPKAPRPATAGCTTGPAREAWSRKPSKTPSSPCPSASSAGSSRPTWATTSSAWSNGRTQSVTPFPKRRSRSATRSSEQRKKKQIDEYLAKLRSERPSGPSTMRSSPSSRRPRAEFAAV